MTYGIQVFDQDGVDLTEEFIPVFYIDSIDVSGSGSKSYAIDYSGFALRAELILQYNYNVVSPPLVTISGNTVYWSNIPVTNPPIQMLVYLE